MLNEYQKDKLELYRPKLTVLMFKVLLKRKCDYGEFFAHGFLQSFFQKSRKVRNKTKCFVHITVQGFDTKLKLILDPLKLTTC